MSALDLPVVGGDNDTWGTKVNVALTQLQTEGDAALNAEIARATEAEASGFNPTADVAFNGHKATGLANGTTAGDAATFGQIPAALHANDTDLATSGHPATALTVDGTGLAYVATGSVQQGMEDLDGGIQSHTHAAISLHADLTDLTTSGHPASAITNTLTGMTSITHTDVQNALHDLDVAITGAGGGSSLLFTRWKAGGYYGPTMFGSTFASNAISNNTIRAVPFVVATSHTFTALGLETVAVGAGASILRLGVYNDAGDGSPGALRFTAGTIDTSNTGGTGFKTATTGQPWTLPAGIYWLAAQCETGATGTQRCIAANGAFVAATSDTGNAQAGCYLATSTAGSLGDPFPSTGFTVSQNAPNLKLVAT
jgi:hypothetical protein